MRRSAPISSHTSPRSSDMRHGVFAGVIFAALLAGTVASAESATDLQCTFRHPIVEVGSIEEVPWPIQNIILARMDTRAREDAKFQWHTVMAPRGKPYNATDVVTDPGLPSRRFIRAGHEGTEWFVWFERGGIAYSKHILFFHLRLGHGVPVVRASMTYGEQNPCALTDDLLDGKPAAGPADPVW